MKVKGIVKVIVEVKRSFANVYDEDGDYYQRFPVAQDSELAPGDYKGYPILDYITYKDKRTNEFKSFIVLSDVEE